MTEKWNRPVAEKAAAPDPCQTAKPVLMKPSKLPPGGDPQTFGKKKFFLRITTSAVLLDQKGQSPNSRAGMALRKCETAKKNKTSQVQKHQRQIQSAEENAQVKPEDPQRLYHVARVWQQRARHCEMAPSPFLHETRLREIAQVKNEIRPLSLHAPGP